MQQALQSGKSGHQLFSMQHPAAGMALLLGACSGNPPATSSGTTSPPDANGGSNGDGDGDGGAGSTELQAANTAFGAAQTAVMAAKDAAATLAETPATEAAYVLMRRRKIANGPRGAWYCGVSGRMQHTTAALEGDDDNGNPRCLRNTLRDNAVNGICRPMSWKNSARFGGSAHLVR